MLVVVTILATLLLVQAFASRKMPDLETWHRVIPTDFTAVDLDTGFDLERYLRLEQSLFDELSEYVLDPDDLQGHSIYSRFVRGGAQDPARQPRNWNRTVELVPDEVRGGVLLLHGLSDSPYSMRSVAELFVARGYHVLAMRMPGHGTVPAGLLEVTWQDWAAAVTVGARHLQDQIDASMPFFVGGYSNGGALSVDYCLVALDDDGLRVPDRLFLFSPAIGVTPFARVARWDALYGFIPYFEKSKWLSIEPEYDPYKYNSFPKNAGTQSWRLANDIQNRLDELESQGRMQQLPPILAFQSVVDDTVVAEDLITRLYDRLESNGSEVVLFDVNHSAALDGFYKNAHQPLLDRLMQSGSLDYTATRITNRDRRSQKILARSRLPHSESAVEQDLELEWPDHIFSLAHVAIPFPPDDPIYGSSPADPAAFALHLGAVALWGERHVLKIPASQLIRIRHNPFHSYMVGRILEAIGDADGHGEEESAE